MTIETSIRIHPIDGKYEYFIQALTLYKGRNINTSYHKTHPTILPNEDIENIINSLKEELEKKIDLMG